MSEYIYVNNKTGEEYTLGQLQDKYGYGFADERLWTIVRSLYHAELREGKEPEDIMFEEDQKPAPFPWQIPIDAMVWFVDRDMTTERRWVDGYDKDGKTIYLRTIQNPKKNNRGMKGYPSQAVGSYIHRTYQEARLCIKMRAVRFDFKEAEHGKDGNHAGD